MEALTTALDQTIERACGYFLRQQDPGGFWVGELESNATITAEYVFFRRLLNLEHERQDHGAARQLLDTQADGGWPIYFGGPPDLNATIEAAVALQLAGVPADDPVSLAAAEVIRSLGGLAHARVFTRIWLSFLGALPPEAVPVMPAEMVLQPRASPLSIYRFSSWARGTIVPLLILLNRPVPYHGPVPDVSAYWTAERHFVPRRARQQAGPTSLHSAARTLFRRIDRHRRLLAPAMRWEPALALSIDACRRWLLAHQEEDGGWGGIQPAMVHSTLALAACGKDPDAIARAAAAVEGFCIREDGRLRMQSCVSPGWDTPWTMLALRAAGIPAGHPAIASAATWLAAQQSNTYGDWALSAPGVPAGGWPFEFANANYPDTDDTAVVLQALAASTVAAKAARASGLLWLLGMQNDDGGWAAFDRANDTALVQ
ncbi:MAG: squalene--hopene cyclase, partial [Anaerolineae bacterium]